MVYEGGTGVQRYTVVAAIVMRAAAAGHRGVLLEK